MKAIKRTKSPDFLKANKKSWTSSYINGAAFTWHNKQKEIIAELRKMSQNHCAFCDDLLFPLVGEHGEIEHFKPKEQFKHYAYAWANLYPICRRCNGTKNDRFDKLLLRPILKITILTIGFGLTPVHSKSNRLPLIQTMQERKKLSKYLV